MGDDRKTGKARIARLRNSRPTIGLLIGRIGDQRYQADVWPGVADVAEERDVNLICFVGGALRAAHEFDSQRNVVYDLVNSEGVDGLVAMSGSIGQFIGKTLPVLWEATSILTDSGCQLEGLTDNYIWVTATAPEPRWNQMDDVQLISIGEVGMKGKIAIPSRLSGR